MRARKRAFANYLVVILTLLWSAALVSGPVWASAAPGAQTAMLSPVSKAQVAKGFGQLPLFFTENQGQTDAQVKYFTLGQGHSIFFTPKGAVLSLSRASNEVNRSSKGGKKGKDGRSVVQLRPQGIRSGVEILATEPLAGKVNYFQGNDPGKWRTEVPTYKSVLYREAYKGIDLKFYGAGQQLEYDLVIKPGADPKQAKFLFQGVKALKVTKEGDLSITLPDGGKLVQKSPVIYQEIDGQRISREGKFRILPGTGQRGYGFELASYDARYPLIIDPVVLGYSTYLGGSTWESGNAIAVNATTGEAFVAGSTESTNFPSANNSLHGFRDAFVAKFNPAGSALVYATYLGGALNEDPNIGDIGLGIAVDAAGNAYVTGETASADFPRLNPFQNTLNGISNAFVSKLSTAGALTYSTYLGGSGSDLGVSIAVDNAIPANAYVAGNTTSANFPTAGAHVQVALGGAQNAFVAKITTDATGAVPSLAYSTFLGGSVSENAWGVAVDPVPVVPGGIQCIYVAGDTASFDFPLSIAPNPLPFQNAIHGATDAFVAKINPLVLGQLGLVYSTFLGGVDSNNSASGGVALDAAGNFYVAGSTDSPSSFNVPPGNFPITPGAFQTTLNGLTNAFVTKFNGTTGTPVYSTYLGGDGLDTAWWIAVDAFGNAYVTGETSSSNFPLFNSLLPHTLTGFSNAFVTNLNSQGNGLAFSTYLGGTISDTGFGVALDLNRRVYVTGVTSSADFPVRGGLTYPPGTVFPGTGGSTAFVTQLRSFSVVPLIELLLLDN